MLYSRDTSLDPQLVWKGKDEQDAKDLAVPVVPIYVQEHVSPHRLIENLRSRPDDRKTTTMNDATIAAFNPLPANQLQKNHTPTCALSKASSRRVEKTRRLLPFAYASWAKGRRLAEMEIPRAKGGR